MTSPNGGRTIYVGWVEYNVLAYIVAVTLARHKLQTRSVRLQPFALHVYQISRTLPKDESGVVYAIGSFTDRNIDEIISTGQRTTVIGKIYGKKYGNISSPMRVGSVKIYPVKKVKKGGVEYLEILIRYFDLSSELPFFTKMMTMRNTLGELLTLTDGWVDAFKLLTSIEVVTSPEDIDKIVGYLRKVKGFDEAHNKLTKTMTSSVVARGKNYAVLDLRNSSLHGRQAVALSNYVLKNVPVVVCITNADGGAHEVTLGIKRRIPKTVIVEMRRQLQPKHMYAFENGWIMVVQNVDSELIKKIGDVMTRVELEVAQHR